MAIGIRLGSIVDEIGASSFLNAFFSTIVGLLENGNPGAVYPVVSINLYDGSVPVDKLEQAVYELKSIREALSKFPPSAVIWDIEDRSKTPPWGENISPEISSMANYFVSSTGRDLFDVLGEVFSHAIKTHRSVKIVEI